MCQVMRPSRDKFIVQQNARERGIGKESEKKIHYICMIDKKKREREIRERERERERNKCIYLSPSSKIFTLMKSSIY